MGRRFASVAMGEWHLVSAVCYGSLNPVRARLATRAEDWPWSSVRAHMNGADDGLVTVRPVLDRVPNFAALLSTTEDQDFAHLRLAEGSGRPLGTAEFVTGPRTIARQTDRAPRSRTQTHDLHHRRTTKIAAIGIMSTHFPTHFPRHPDA
jgi:putative transposase